VEDIRITDDLGERDKSLALMREAMIVSNDFEAAFFIGGMEGVEDEFHLFVKAHPDAKVFPVASTGAAAKILYEAMKETLDSRLYSDMAYGSLFKDLMKI
jgi:hypothetical protein